MTEQKAPLTEHDRGLRRREWLMLYLPMIIGALLMLALVVVIAVLGLRQDNLAGGPASAWGDTAAIIVILEVMLISVVPLVALVGLCALFFWMYNKSRPLLLRGEELTGRVERRVDQASESLVARMIKPYAASARLSAVKQLFRRSNV